MMGDFFRRIAASPRFFLILALVVVLLQLFTKIAFDLMLSLVLVGIIAHLSRKRD